MVAIDPDRLARDNSKVAYDPEFAQHAAWARGEWGDGLRLTMDGVVAAVEKAVGKGFTARRHAPASVEVSVMQRPESDDLIVQLVNYGVDLQGKVTPARDVRISVSPPGGGQVSSVEWHALDAATAMPPLRQRNGCAEFTVPEVGIYGVGLVRVGGGG